MRSGDNNRYFQDYKISMARFWTSAVVHIHNTKLYPLPDEPAFTVAPPPDDGPPLDPSGSS
ncbi:hypothetical protein TELCIR_15212 [Teladorsagia circumcincta]|uniref:Uncharacterized protein n=1 Tax=Teladorsagia circumcincta TaxID=45464 RepID=A0A2G9TYT5_TELCI|nr:hypothetical protein TELCIR_15212 [Teladorsagia circumcincta]